MAFHQFTAVCIIADHADHGNLVTHRASPGRSLLPAHLGTTEGPAVLRTKNNRERNGQVPLLAGRRLQRGHNALFGTCVRVTESPAMRYHAVALPERVGMRASRGNVRSEEALGRRRAREIAAGLQRVCWARESGSIDAWTGWCRVRAEEAVLTARGREARGARSRRTCCPSW
jgi:hypothetical protein